MIITESEKVKEPFQYSLESVGEVLDNSHGLNVTDVLNDIIKNYREIARRGSSDVRLEVNNNKGKFLYIERGKRKKDVKVNKEVLSLYINRFGYYIPIYRGTSTLAIIK